MKTSLKVLILDKIISYDLENRQLKNVISFQKSKKLFVL